MTHWTIDNGLSQKHACWLGKIEWGEVQVVQDAERWGAALEREAEALRKRFPDKESLDGNPLIQSAATAYRAYGVNPRRYPPACEALIKRVIQGKPVPIINSMVDLNNLLSLRTLCPVGSYNLNRVVGDVSFQLGLPTHEYTAIGGSQFAAHNFPTFVDEEGPFGGCSRDSMRTLVVPETIRITTMVMSFENPESHGLDEILKTTIQEVADAGFGAGHHEWIGS